MHWENASFLFVTYCVDQVDDREDGDEGSEDKFGLIEKVSRDVSIAAAFNVINLQQGEDPEKCAWYKDENCLLEAWC